MRARALKSSHSAAVDSVCLRSPALAGEAAEAGNKLQPVQRIQLHEAKSANLNFNSERYRAPHQHKLANVSTANS